MLLLSKPFGFFLFSFESCHGFTDKIRAWSVLSTTTSTLQRWRPRPRHASTNTWNSFMPMLARYCTTSSSALEVSSLIYLSCSALLINNKVYYPAVGFIIIDTKLFLRVRINSVFDQVPMTFLYSNCKTNLSVDGLVVLLYWREKFKILFTQYPASVVFHFGTPLLCMLHFHLSKLWRSFVTVFCFMPCFIASIPCEQRICFAFRSY